MAGQRPRQLPEGLFDFSCPYDCHNLLGVEQEDVERMRCLENTPDAYLGDNCIRAIVLHSVHGQEAPHTAFFDPGWLTNWNPLSFNAREDQCWNQHPRPLYESRSSYELLLESSIKVWRNLPSLFEWFRVVPALHSSDCRCCPAD